MRSLSLVALGTLILVACGQAVPAPTTRPSPGTPATTATIPAATTTTVPQTTTTTDRPASTTTTISPFARPDWLGTRILPLRDDGFGEVTPTPQELQQRKFATVDLLAPPAAQAFAASIDPIPSDVLARTTWHEECPVTVDQLMYMTITYWGFDGAIHTGEIIVNASVADELAWVFEQLFDQRFPIEQMQVIALEELDAPPTGDFNNTTSFVCRPVVSATSGWSQHAYGLAVDINPFHNPYEKGDLVLPELASYYLDRTLAEPGMVFEGDVVTQAFAEIGWGWGGNWNTLDDYMHFSENGR